MVVDLPDTELPCPEWCALTPGHGFDSVIAASGLQSRGHELSMGEVFDSDGECAWVDIYATETANDQEEEALMEPPSIVLGGGLKRATAADAETLASYLRQAAEKLRQIEGER